LVDFLGINLVLILGGIGLIVLAFYFRRLLNALMLHRA